MRLKSALLKLRSSSDVAAANNASFSLPSFWTPQEANVAALKQLLAEKMKKFQFTTSKIQNRGCGESNIRVVHGKFELLRLSNF